jgi:small GTP-binding protein
LLYKNFDSCILVFDKTNRESFKECQEYFSDTIKEKCKSDIKVILVGNKIDLENEIEVSYEEAAKFALLNNYLYIETSCVRNKNVFEAFEKIIGLAYLEYLKSKGKTITIQDDKKDFSMKLLKFYSY